MIEFKAVSKRFGPKIVLDSLSVTVGRGEIVFVIGKSGTGKSVFLKHIVGLLKPDSGEIWVEGKEIAQATEEALFPVRRECGMVFQFPALLDSLSVRENLAFGPRAHGLYPGEQMDAEIERALGLVRLPTDILNRFPPEMSYGMQKRASLARALVLRPKYLLYDEPTTGLDPVNTAGVNALIQRLSRELKVTSVVVSHDMHCALAIADRILCLEAGRCVAQGTVEEVSKSTHPTVAAFLQEAKERMHD